MTKLLHKNTLKCFAYISADLFFTLDVYAWLQQSVNA